MSGVGILGVVAKAKNGSSRSLSFLYWGWIRHIAIEEGAAIPQSGVSVDSLSEADAKKLASAIRTRAEKIRRGLAPRDASGFVQQTDDSVFPATDGKDVGTLSAEFDDPDDMDETADFFESSGGVKLRYS